MVPTRRVNHLGDPRPYTRSLVRSPTRAPRSTTRSIIRATLVTALVFGGLAVLLVSTRDTSATSATGTTVPTTRPTTAAPTSTAVDAPAPAKPASPTTAKKRSTSTTTPAAPTTAVTTATTAKKQPTPSTPEAFARGLYDAWEHGSRSAAAAVATPAAVTALFAEKPAAVRPYTFEGCTGAAGSEVCRFDGADGHALEMKVRTGTGGLPMLVTEVKFPPPGE